MPAELREEAERKIVENDRPNTRVRLHAHIAAAAGGSRGFEGALHDIKRTHDSQFRDRIHTMLRRLYPEAAPYQQLLKTVAISCVREAWIKRALVPIWVSDRVMKTQSEGRSSRRRASVISDRGLLPAMLQVTSALRMRVVSACAANTKIDSLFHRARRRVCSTVGLRQI
jgi:hypothetical protein